MPSKFLVPLEVPDFQGTPSSTADAGYVLLFIKTGWLTKRLPDGSLVDLVLQRPLDGFTEFMIDAAPVVATDTVLEAIQKIQRSLSTLQLQGDVTGTAAYNAGILEIVTTYNGNTAASVATAFDTNHYAGIANPYIAGDIVYKDGHIFQALYTNDAIVPTIGGNLYWQDLGLGNVLRQTPVDWDATSGDSQILNKPNIPTLVSELTNDLGFLSAEVDTLDSVTGRGNITLNTITVGGITATGPTSTIYAGTGTKLRTEANNLVFERESSSGFMKFYINQTTLSPTAKSYLGYNNATLNVVLSNEYSTGNLELRTQDIIRQHIFANGNVVIGSSSPTDAGYKLDVNGSVRAQGIFYGIDIRTGAHSFRDQMHISHTADGFTRQSAYNAAGAHALTFIGDLRFASSAAIKSVFAFNGTYSNNGTIYTGEMSLMKIFTGDAIGNTVNTTGLDNYGINLMPTLNYTTGTSTFTGFFYNPTLTSTTGLTHYAMDFVTGLIKFRVLAGAGTRMVVADAAGVLSTQTISTGFTLPSLTAGSVLFSDGTTIAQDNANLFWDNVNNWLGIGTATPQVKVEVYGINELLRFGDGTSGNDAYMSFNSRGFVGFKGSGGLNFIANTTRPIIFGVGANFNTFTEAARFAASTGNLLVGTATDGGFKFDVNGTARYVAQTYYGTFSESPTIYPSDTSINYAASAASLAFYLRNGGGGSGRLIFSSAAKSGTTTATQYLAQYTATFNPTSGTGLYTMLELNPTINQTGGANGITRGLYIQPTLIAAADWRAIEISSGGVYINTTSVAASAILQADSTTRGFLPPRMTTTQKNAIASPAAGLVVYDSTDNKHYGYDGSAWYSFLAPALGFEDVLLNNSVLTTDHQIDATGTNMEWIARKTNWSGDGFLQINMDDGSNKYARQVVSIFGGGPASITSKVYDYTNDNTTAINLYTTSLQIQTFQYSTKAAGDVLTLVDPLTGEVEYATPGAGGVTASESIINALIFG
jgi:hypothetical protein